MKSINTVNTAASKPTFVRRARVEDSAVIGEIHALTMAATLGAVTDLGQGRPEQIFSAQAIGAQWSQAIASPPDERYAVFVATDADQVVGFAALAPAAVLNVEVGQGQISPLVDRPGDGEIIALEVHPNYQRQGHGSRLIAALSDYLYPRNATRVIAWVMRGEQARTRFLTGCGFAPAGITRTFDVGGEQVCEDCWYTDLVGE